MGQERNLVLQSIETADGHLCVDIFQRPDGSYGFEGYRRDVEDGRGWFAISSHGARRFERAADALSAARAAFTWLEDYL